MPDNPSYIIVGSGAFGASTALHLIRKHPGASIYLLDRDRYDAPTRVAASWDWNKVIRADYNGIVYAKLAAEAQGLWRTDPIWKPFYHESGVLWISPTSFAQNVLRNTEALGVKADLQTYSVEEARTLCDGLFKDADYTGVSEVLLNRSSGWAEAKEALQSTIEASIALGVKYVTTEVAALIIEGAGASRRCCGVVIGEGTRMHADKIILCTGAFTPRLLVDSAPGSPDLHAGERILAAAVTEATATLTAEELPILHHMPVAINDNPVERGFDVGCLPLPKMGAFKCWGQIIFRNTVQHPSTSEPLSTPPMCPDYAQWAVSPTLRDDVRWALRSTFGEDKSQRSMENHRICWDAVTPSNDFIVSPHSACEGLFIATCGSFHGFKFLPVIGKYVVEMLSRELTPLLQQRWAWDRERPSPDTNGKWSRRELREFGSSESSSH